MIRKIMILCLTVLLLSGCVPNEIRVENHTGENEGKAEEIFKDDTRLKAVAALFHEDQLLVGIRVKTFSRFTKRKIAKEIKKELEKEYSEMEVTVSADSKILMETSKLLDKQEEDKKIKKKIKHVISLSEEET
ncbi:hypothetical protein ACFQ38_13215 [Sporosarcina contaminans]|uniref:Sporulation lipoprotein YhcN/YlaJ (Spore_YhcN_YlaJ) n=1 Tax=Sporosarcina contaminans TaxID=633403 RepID=A0ABW3U382_9BACL